MRYEITQHNLHICDSHLVAKREMIPSLQDIRTAHPDSEVWRRTDRSLRREWATHNLLYALGIARQRTKDVDLNYPQKWYVRMAYGICGALALIFIK